MGGKLNPADASLHSAGVRELSEETGLSESEWRGLVVRGPDAHALPLTTYYCYTLNRPIPQALMRRCSNGRSLEEKQKVQAWAWVPVDSIEASEWRSEDADLIARLAKSSRGGGGC